MTNLCIIYFIHYILYFTFGRAEELQASSKAISFAGHRVPVQLA